MFSIVKNYISFTSVLQNVSYGVVTGLGVGLFVWLVGYGFKYVIKLFKKLI